MADDTGWMERAQVIILGGLGPGRRVYAEVRLISWICFALGARIFESDTRGPIRLMYSMRRRKSGFPRWRSLPSHSPAPIAPSSYLTETS
eukprot:1810452-Rhodomonas_salina.1